MADSEKTFRYQAGMAPPEPPPVEARRLLCPHCGAAVDLLLPGKSETVRCQKCLSILEPEHAALKLREAYNEQFPHRLWIPLGREGILDGIKYKCVGMVVREDEEHARWSEYLLFNPYHGYRYLVESYGNWTLVEPHPGLGLDAKGYPVLWGSSANIRLAGKKFRYYSHYRARIVNIIGEFPWRASIGETNEITEYINPPYQASCEQVIQYLDREGNPVDIAALMAAEHGNADAQHSDDEEKILSRIIRKRDLRQRTTEIHWSVGQYKYPEEIKAAFQLDELPPKEAFGMCEPNPLRTRFWLSLAITALLSLVSCASCVYAINNAEQATVLEKKFILNTAEFELKREGDTDYLEFSFEPGEIILPKETNVEFDLKSLLEQQWLSLNIFMIHSESGAGYIYDAELSRYFGVSDDGESWSEGSETTSLTTVKMPPGKYNLYAIGATNVGIYEFKQNLKLFGESASGMAQQLLGPRLRGATQQGMRGVVLPQNFAGKENSPKLELTLRVTRDVPILDWLFPVFLWLIGWNIFYLVRYRSKEKER
ncbi:MAG: DUF4178 domain-containing protein [Turneriella sp.]|nr:DUF4178 domain-containing protein [Leptospiraceae bacterium]MCX7632134.1 DUF4178 domain-containing protein [Turneriella sp.]